MTLRPPSLSAGMWVIVATIAMSVIAVSVEFTLTANLVTGGTQQAQNDRVSSVERIVGGSSSAWRNPAWQRHAAAGLAALDTEAAIFRPGQHAPIFATRGAPRYLDTANPAGTAAQVPYDTPTVALQSFQRIALRRIPHGAVVGVVYLWYTAAPPGEPSGVWWFGIAYGTIALL